MKNLDKTMRFSMGEPVTKGRLSKFILTLIVSLCLMASFIPAASIKAFATEDDVAIEADPAISEEATVLDEEQSPSETTQVISEEETEGKDFTDQVEEASEPDDAADDGFEALSMGEVGVGGATTNMGNLPINTSKTITIPGSNYLYRYTYRPAINCALRITGSATDAIHVKLYSGSGNEVASDSIYKNNITGEASFDLTYYLNSGVYYIGFDKLWLTSASFSVTFKATVANTGASFNEATGGNNNTMSSAWPINTGTTYKAQFSHDKYPTYSYDEDYYKVIIDNPCEIMVTASTTSRCGVEAFVYDGNGKRIKSLFGVYSSTTGRGSFSDTTDLVNPGVYWILFQPSSMNYKGGIYTFSVKAVHTMYRLYNPNSGEHFYTESKTERDAIWHAGWEYEGIAWKAPVTSKTPVYRLYSGSDHHYTSSAAERDKLKQAGWKYEGIGWYSDDAKSMPLYRQFNPNVNPHASKNNSGSHNYTTSKAENDSLVRAGWKGEGIGWYGC